MTGGTNLAHAREFNRRVVLQTVRLHGPLSRASIARRTGLAMQTVSNIAAELSEEGLLREEGQRRGLRGAPAFDLGLNPDGGFTFGVSLDHRRLVMVLVDFVGRVRHQEALSIEGIEPDDVLRRIKRLAGTLARREGAPLDRFWGAGVVMPMIFEDGAPISFGPTSMPAWERIPVVAWLSRSLGMEVVLENDATAAAVGEQLYGTGRRLRDFFYIYIGVGVGGGMILAGSPYRGSQGRAGELGHVIVEPGGRACQCGNRGCLERYASLSAAQHALDGLPEGTSLVDPRWLDDRIDDLDGWLELAAGHLSTACRTVDNLLNPEAIVIGGIASTRLLQQLMGRLNANLDRLCAGGRRIAILQAEADLETPALGGAALPLFNGLTPTTSLLHK